MSKTPAILTPEPAATAAVVTTAVASPRPTLRGHLQIARFDHWVKNVFVLPGILVALGVPGTPWDLRLLWRIVVGLLATGFIASSNYIINEVMDAPFDRQHPTKCRRPVPAGLVSVPVAYAQWIAFMAVGLAMAYVVSIPLTITLAVLWIMGLIYNIPPIRSKDLPYVDVLSESVNNPLRMLAGWYIVGPAVAVAPASLLMSYWMVGCYFMAVKRFAEYRMIGNAGQAKSYRRSFGYYNERRLLVSIMFYASAAMLFFGAFIMRYRIELVLSFPFVALVMSIYLAIAFKDDSAVQAPEKLYKEPRLMAAVIVCTVVMMVLMSVKIEPLQRLLEPLGGPAMTEQPARQAPPTATPSHNPQAGSEVPPRAGANAGQSSDAASSAEESGSWEYLRTGVRDAARSGGASASFDQSAPAK